MDNAPFELEPDAQELRRLAGERYEDMYRALLKGIEAGEPRANRGCRQDNRPPGTDPGYNRCV